MLIYETDLASICVRMKIFFFLNIIAWQCPFCECNSNFFQNQENKYKKNHFSKSDVEQPVQRQMGTNLVFPYSN